MELTSIITQSCILVISAGAALMDLFSWKVSNLWVYSWSAAGICFAALVPEGVNLAGSLLGLLVPLLLLGWLFWFHMMGAGDIKLFCTLGIWMGPGAVLNCMLVSFLAASVIAIVSMIIRKNARKRFAYMGNYFLRFIRSGVKTDYGAAGASQAKLPLAVPILIAVILRTVGLYR